jgi:hypothetical protein
MGAALGATRMNNSPVPRTQVDDRQERRRGHGPSWAAPDAGTGSYGSRARGRRVPEMSPNHHQQAIATAAANL